MNGFPCAASGSQDREWTAGAIDNVGDTALGAGRVTAAFTSR